MGLGELFILALGLAADAFAVSVCKGLGLGRIRPRHMALAGAWFGGAQALMPLIGFYLGRFFAGIITAYDHWAAFALLLVIGGKMVWEALESAELEDVDAAMDAGTMLPLAVATSIDALAVGVTLAFLEVDILPAAAFIGAVTALCSAAGLKAGSVFGARYKRGAELTGGCALVLIGLKILLEGLGIL